MERRELPSREAAERKMRMLNELFRFAFEAKRFQIRLRQPHLTERELNHRAYALIEKGCR